MFYKKPLKAKADMKCYSSSAYIGLLLIGLTLALSSCEEVVEPSLISANPILVVEGIVTDDFGDTRVNLSETTAFNDPNPNPQITGARVRVREGTSGQSYTFIEAELGVYVPLDPGFRGIPGTTYSLEISTVEGEDYFSNTRMPFPLRLDSLSYEWQEETVEREEGFYVFYHYQDPDGPNYHLLEVWKNGQLQSSERIEVRSDENVSGKYLRLEIPSVFAPSDTVGLKILTLPSDAFEYYLGVNTLIEAGGPSEAVPENPVGNINGEQPSLGLFKASAVTEFEIILPEE